MSGGSGADRFQNVGDRTPLDDAAAFQAETMLDVRQHVAPPRAPLPSDIEGVAEGGNLAGPTHQQRGIGRALLGEATRSARAFPAQAIWLDAYDAPAGAGGFYAACGFRECGRRAYRSTPLVYFEQAIDARATDTSR